jgi:release factor glutamine methyltransferase
MSQSDPWTVGRLLAWTTEYLQRHGSDSPRLDAEVLLAEARGCTRIELYTAFDEVVGDGPRGVFRDLVRRRAEGTPVAYLVGRREFYSLSFRVTEDVLIPRPETELLVVALLDLARERSPEGAAPEIADVGTGSGVIAVCAAKHLPRARVTAIDLSPAALEVAGANARDHGVADRIELVESNLFDAVPAERRFDFVVSNPPYVRAEEFDALARDVKGHEPRAALVAGPRGTEVIERLAAQAAERLRPGGCLLVEIGPAIHEAARAIVEAGPAFEIGPTIKDQARLPRVIQARRRE